MKCRGSLRPWDESRLAADLARPCVWTLIYADNFEDRVPVYAGEIVGPLHNRVGPIHGVKAVVLPMLAPFDNSSHQILCNLLCMSTELVVEVGTQVPLG